MSSNTNTTVRVRNEAKKRRKNRHQIQQVEHGIDVDNDAIPQPFQQEKKYQGFRIGIWNLIESHKLANKQPQKKNPKNVTSKDLKIDNTSNRFIINPKEPWKVRWDLLVMILVVYYVVILPFDIGFPQDPSDSDYVIEIISVVAFSLDIIASFNTGYNVKQSDLFVTDRLKIAKKYLIFWFWIDLISTIPFSLIFSSANSSQNQSVYILSKLFRLLRLFRLVKLMKISHLKEVAEDLKIDSSVISLVGMALALFFVCHILACFWHLIGISNSNYDNTWISDFGFTDLPTSDRYVASIYWAIVTMVTVGYGDIHATNDPERIYEIFAMLTGGIVFGLLISKITRIIEARNPNAKAQSDLMDEFRSYLNTMSLPPALSSEAKVAYEYYLVKKTSFGESATFEQLPEALLNQVIHEVYRHDVKTIHLFQSYNPNLVSTLLLNTRPFQCAKNERLYSVGDVCQDIIFLSTGVVKLSTDMYKGPSENKRQNSYWLKQTVSSEAMNSSLHGVDRRSIVEFIVGFCTEGSYIGDFEYCKKTCSVANYTAATSCNMISINYKVFDNVLQNFVGDGVKLLKEFNHRYSHFRTVLKNQNVKMMTDANVDTSGHDDNCTSTKSENKVLTTKEAVKTNRRSSSMHNREQMWVNGEIKPLEEAGKNVEKLFLTANNEFDDDEGTEHMVGVKKSMIHIVRHDEKTGEQRIELVQLSQLQSMHLIHPSGKYKLRWDLIIGAIIVISSMIVPMEIAFNTSVFGDQETACNLGFNCMFFIDIFASFRTIYLTENHDAYIIDWDKIATRYIKGWFIIDFISSLPIDSIIAWTSLIDQSSLQSSTTAGRLLRVLRFARLLKLLRILRIPKYMAKLEDYFRIPPPVLDMCVILGQVFVIAHFTACIWWGLSPSFTSTHWYDNVVVGETNEVLINSAISTQYLTSLYFSFETVQTVGYGDIIPVNTSERIVAIFIVTLGATMFGYMLSKVSGLVDAWNQVGMHASNRLSEITQYLQEKQISRSLNDAVVGQFKELFRNSFAFNEEQILSRLPPKLRSELRVYRYGDTMAKISIFHFIPNESVRLFIFSLMTPSFYPANDVIIQEGDASDGIKFLVSGSAVVIRNLTKQRLDQMMAAKLKFKKIVPLMQKSKSFIMDSGTHAIDKIFKKPLSGKSQRGLWSKSPRRIAVLNEEDQHFDDREIKRMHAPQSLNEDTLAKHHTDLQMEDYEEKESNDGSESFQMNGPSKVVPAIPLYMANQEKRELENSDMSVSPRAKAYENMDLAQQTSSADYLSNAFNGYLFPHLISQFNQKIINNHLVSGNLLKYVGDVNEGDMIGHLALIKETVHLSSIQAVEPCRVYNLSKPQLLHILRKFPHVAFSLQRALSEATIEQRNVRGKLQYRKYRAAFVSQIVKEFELKLSHDFNSAKPKDPAVSGGKDEKHNKKQSDLPKRKPIQKYAIKLNNVNHQSPRVGPSNLSSISMGQNESKEKVVVHQEVDMKALMYSTLKKRVKIRQLMGKNRAMYDSSDEEEKDCQIAIKNNSTTTPASQQLTKGKQLWKSIAQNSKFKEMVDEKIESTKQEHQLKQSVDNKASVKNVNLSPTPKGFLNTWSPTTSWTKKHVKHLSNSKLKGAADTISPKNSNISHKEKPFANFFQKLTAIQRNASSNSNIMRDESNNRLYYKVPFPKVSQSQHIRKIRSTSDLRSIHELFDKEKILFYVNEKSSYDSNLDDNVMDSGYSDDTEEEDDNHDELHTESVVVTSGDIMAKEGMYSLLSTRRRRLTYPIYANEIWRDISIEQSLV